MEGYGEVTGIIEENLYLNYEGEKTGLIRLTEKLQVTLKCEINAGKRLIKKIRQSHPKLPLIIVTELHIFTCILYTLLYR